MTTSGIPSGTYTGLVTDGVRYFYSLNLAVDGPTLSNPSNWVAVDNSGTSYTPEQGDPLWLNIYRTSFVIAYVYNASASQFQVVQAYPGSKNSNGAPAVGLCRCNPDSRNNVSVPYMVSCDSITQNGVTVPFNPSSVSAIGSPSIASNFDVPPNIPITVTGKTAGPIRSWLLFAAYAISSYLYTGSTCDARAAGEAPSELVPLGQPSNYTGLNITAKGINIPYYQIEMFVSMGNGVFWLAGVYQPNRDCVTGQNNPCSKLLTDAPYTADFTFVPWQDMSPGLFAPVSIPSTVPTPIYSPGGPPAIVYPTNFMAQEFGAMPGTAYMPLPISKTVSGTFDQTNPLYYPALPCLEGFEGPTDGLAIIGLTNNGVATNTDVQLYFSYRWPCLGVNVLIVVLAFDSSTQTGTLLLLDQYNTQVTVTLADTVSSPAYAWLYMNATNNGYQLTGGFSNTAQLAQPKAFSSSKYWLQLDQKASSSYTPASNAISTAWQTMSSAYELQNNAPAFLLSLGAYNAGPGFMGVNSYTTLTADQAVCQAANGGICGMQVPTRAQSSVGAYTNISNANSVVCDQLMQSLCTINPTNPAEPFVDDSTCCVFRSAMVTPGSSPSLNGVYMATCFDKNCTGSAPSGGGPPPAIGGSYRPASVTNCANFCGNILNFNQAQLNELNSVNQTVYCSGSGSGGGGSTTSYYILIGLLILIGAGFLYYKYRG